MTGSDKTGDFVLTIFTFKVLEDSGFIFNYSFSLDGIN
jgi:hypothetical protein